MNRIMLKLKVVLMTKLKKILKNSNILLLKILLNNNKTYSIKIIDKQINWYNNGNYN